jgi:hypothetical protein
MGVRGITDRERPCFGAGIRNDEGMPALAQWGDMTPRPVWAAGLVLSALTLQCGGSRGDLYNLAVGADDGGGMFAGGDAATGPLDAQIQQDHIAVTVVTLSCAGDCATVAVVASGGYPPYAFQWSDGSTSQTRQVCPTATTHYGVAVTDSGSTGEVPRPAQTIDRALTASVLACPDGGPDLGNPTGEKTVVVPGTADIWLAGQPDGAMLSSGGPDGDVDTTPAESPVAIPVVAGSTLTFSATGGTSYTGGICTGSSPDGGCTILLVSEGAGNAVSSLATPMNALLGVFLDASVPSGPPPAPLDASGSNDFATLAPLLRQVFFIGDGLTGTGSGAVQRFTVPAGATRLALASSDEAGGNFNNSGQFNVTVSSF